jgi:hypothetical protein
VLARRRGGIAEAPDEDLRPLDVRRPLLTGTMAEAVGVAPVGADGAAGERTGGGQGW